MPGVSGIPLSVTRASSVECVTAVMSGCSTVSSSPTTTVPGSSVKLDRQWMLHAVVAGVLDGAQLQDAGARADISSISSKETTGSLRASGTIRGSAAEDARDVRVDLADLGAYRRARATAVVSEPPRPSVVTSLAVDTPWKARDEHDRVVVEAARIRSARTSRMRAFVCDVSVTMPAWDPVSEIARCPRSLIAIAHSAQDWRSPVDRSMSISRGRAFGEISIASAMRKSVVLRGR